MNEINDHRENNTIKLSSDDRDKGNDKDHTLQYLRSPTIQNLNDLLLSCVKKDEYCYSMIDYFKKMFNFRQVDYYLAYIQLIYCFQPKEITKMAKNRKHLKNKWARDDPGFLLILIINLFFSSMAFSLSLAKPNPFLVFEVFFTQTCLVLFTFGIIVSAISKFVIDNYFKNDEIGFNRAQTVEFIYAFDIHCNSFVPWYCFSVIIPFMLLPFTLGRNFIQTIIANSLLCIGALFYFYVTFMSYFTLPFVRQNKYVTLAICKNGLLINIDIGPIIVSYFIATLCNFNIFYYLVSVVYA